MLKPDPLNIKILRVNKNPLTEFKLVSSLRIFEQGTQNFDKKGLFSTEIFGRVGSEERLRNPGLIWVIFYLKDTNKDTQDVFPYEVIYI